MSTSSPSTWRSAASKAAQQRLEGRFYLTEPYRGPSWRPICVGAMHSRNRSLRYESFLGSVRASAGTCVRLIAPIYVKPFVKWQKNDAADAVAIAEAAIRPNLHYVAVKSAEHQARAVAFRTHQSFVDQRDPLINALRDHLTKFGLVVPQRPANLQPVVRMIDDGAIDLPDAVCDIARLHLDQIALLTNKIEELHSKLVHRPRLRTPCVGCVRCRGSAQRPRARSWPSRRICISLQLAGIMPRDWT